MPGRGAPFRSAPKSRVLPVSAFSQADNASRKGYRECFSSSCAMLAAFHGRVGSDDEYSSIRARFGDTTNSDAQLAALRFLGLEAHFRSDWGKGDLLQELQLGRPVAVGWLHEGSSRRPSGFGHWSVAAGWAPDAVWMVDPNGEADLVRGGYVQVGRAFQGFYSWRNWQPRWDLGCDSRIAPGSPARGWAMTARPSGRK